MTSTLRDVVDVSVTVNGEDVKDTVPARTLLSEFLRRDQFLTGTHRGCETAKCGACTVMVDGKAVKSCNVLAAQVDGSSITTIEGLDEDGELHPLQAAFWEDHGMQCGYCTPGFVMASLDLLQENPDPSVPEIRDELTGNICRCTGYTKIIESIQAAASELSEGSS